MVEIRYIDGDLFQYAAPAPDPKAPLAIAPVIIPHVCNDVGAWGAGFSGAVGAKYPDAETSYRHWAETHQRDSVRVFYAPTTAFALGCTQFVRDINDRNVYVANMVAQVAPGSDAVCVRYDALVWCLGNVAAMAESLAPPGAMSCVHMPMIGAGLAGGDWRVIEALVHDCLCRHGVPVTVYRIPNKR